MAQALGALMGTVGDSGGGHDRLHPPEGRRARPVPQGAVPFRPSAASQSLREAVHHVQGIEHVAGHRNGPVDAPAAFLEGLEDDRLAGEIETFGCQRQTFGNPAARVMQDKAEGPHFARCGFGGLEEGPALFARQVQAAAYGVEQIHGNPDLTQKS